jgi:HEAT repeat protein
MAWEALDRAARNDDFKPVLLDDMINHPDEYVRASAAQALTKYANDAEVRAGFARALGDPSVAVRRVAAGVVDRPKH